MLTKEQYEEIKSRLAVFEAWVDTQRKQTKCRKCKGTGEVSARDAYHINARIDCQKCDGRGFTLGWASYKPEDKPVDIPDVTNEERSAVEVYEFCQNPPQRYSLYIKEQRLYGRDGSATTWTGDELGSVLFGNAFRSGFGDTRVPVIVHAINGKTYRGIYYKSAGDYARVKMAKG